MHLAVLAAELKRRRVIRAVVVWGVVAFAVLQIYEAVMHGLHLPEWTLGFVVVVLGLGFPITVALSWVFDLTARGVEHSPAPEGANLKDPRLALVLLAFGLLAAAPGVAWHFLRQTTGESIRSPSAPTDAPSIAVLSFADMSPGHDQEYFADGVAEEILNSLAHVDGLRVPGRTSSFYFKGKSVKLADIGRELGVATVLEGSVRKEGGRVRITAQLVRVQDETHLWSETYDRELNGVFAVQDDIAKVVVDALKLKLSPRNAAAVPTRNPAAYTEYLLGRQLFYAFHADGSLQHFERATELDPNYAAAWAFVSITVSQLAVNAGLATPKDRERASAAAEKAIALAPEESVGYVARAFLRNLVLWDWAGAEADGKRALSLHTSYVGPYNQYALLLRHIGRTREAIEFGRKATDLDPMNILYWRNLSTHYVSAGELVLARAALTRVHEINPDLPIDSGLALLDLLGGSPAAALARVERSPDALFYLAMAKHDLGQADESQRALDALTASDGNSAPYNIAQVHAWRGDRDHAFECLGRAYDRGDLSLSYVKVDPLLRNLRSDPRYVAFLRKMNLPVD